MLVVDDSALMRRVITQILSSEPGFEVHTARDGEDALLRIQECEPDVITLDINMPKMDGLTALSRIMVERPTPVVMLSSLTQRDALATLEALALGAVDFVAKPSGTVSRDLRKVEGEIIEKVRCAARSRVRGSAVRRPAPAQQKPHHGSANAETRDMRALSKRGAAGAGQGRAGAGRAAEPEGVPLTAGAERAVLIGVSTGGPSTLEQILPELPGDFPYPVLLAIHMPAAFTKSFAQRMDQLCALSVVEVSRATAILPGSIYVGRGDADMIVARRDNVLTAMITPPDPRLPWHPSVDRLVSTAARQVAAEGLLGVQLTGMGDDGARAMAELHKAGGETVAESEESAVVFGMPRVLIGMGGASAVLAASEVAAHILDWAHRKGGLSHAIGA